MKPVVIAPSILSADFAKLGAEIKDVERGGADWIHIDVMDGHFVPNITMGPLVVEAIRPHTRLPLDVHLMIENPDRYIKDFVKAGADLITIHQEASRHLHRSIHTVKEMGAKVGIALNPATPISTIELLLPEVDLVLLMTVNPGFGGQKFIPFVLQKIRALRREAERLGLNSLDIEVDGGINAVTAGQAAKAGANVLVAGSAIFQAENRKKAIEEIRNAASL